MLIRKNIFSPFRTARDRQVIISCRIMGTENVDVPEIPYIYLSAPKIDFGKVFCRMC